LLSRTPHGEFPEYHTSADDCSFVRPDALADTFATCLEVFEVIEADRRLVSTNQKCEPQLGRRGLYRALAGQAATPEHERAMLWLLNLCDGSASLLDVAARSKLPFGLIRQAADLLERHGLLEECPQSRAAGRPVSEIAPAL
jgi:aminopeptidase-like protein